MGACVINKIFNWYLSKNAMPYWVVLVVDSLILFFSGVFAYWMFNLTDSLVEHRFHLIYTLLLDVGISWIGFRLFHTFSGMIRYSSFDDLLRVAYANTTSLVIVLAVQFWLKSQGVEALTVLSYAETAIAFFIATMLMWLERVVIKALFDVTSSNGQALNVLIYGAMSGGVGLAKNIRNQSPKKGITGARPQ